jgi:hypothetical protein
MTPQQKAAHLILTYMAILVKKDLAKQCALATSNELEKQEANLLAYDPDRYSLLPYWQEVKQEIEKL